jgi:hypothetical protein
VQDPLRGCERPVYDTSNDRTALEYYDPLSQKTLKTCKQLCRSRASGLLRSCRQVYGEAAPLFWENAFCFDDLEEFLDTIESLPAAIVESIRHLSVLQDESHYFKQSSGAFREFKYQLCEVTQRMVNLATLEISPSLETCID